MCILAQCHRLSTTDFPKYTFEIIGKNSEKTVKIPADLAPSVQVSVFHALDSQAHDVADLKLFDV